MVIWKAIQQVDGLYEVSNMGEIRRTKTGRILKLHKRKDGRLYVALWANHVYHQLVVSRVVAFAFIENMNSFMQVNFLNEDKTDNRLSNLSICHKVGRIAGKGFENAKKLALSQKTGIYYDSIKDFYKAEGGNMCESVFYKKYKEMQI
jgi:hypothetical protein